MLPSPSNGLLISMFQIKIASTALWFTFSRNTFIKEQLILISVTVEPSMAVECVMMEYR